jgi:hypothetical protein
LSHDTNTPKQDLVDVDSILSNRNVPASKCGRFELNDINVTNFKLHHLPVCGHFLDRIDSRLTHPSKNYRGMSIDRFYDLQKNPQLPIFWNFAANTRLEAKDNFVRRIPDIINPDRSLPNAIPGRRPPNECRPDSTGRCPQ